MKNMVKLIGIIAIIAVIGFSIASCDEDDGGDGNNNNNNNNNNSNNNNNNNQGGDYNSNIPDEVLGALQPGLYFCAPTELTASSTVSTSFVYGDDSTEEQKNTVFWDSVQNGCGKSGNTEYSATILLNRDVTGGSIAYLSRNGLAKATLYIIGLRGDEPGSWTITCDTTEHPAFIITEGVTLVLGENITLKGGDDGQFPVIELTHTDNYVTEDQPRLIMKTGSKIQGNTNNSDDVNGGGVLISVSGTFIMEGGDIIANKTSKCGGGVCVVGNGKFIMLDGNITSNEAGYGGGVYVAPSGMGRFYIQGGYITGNEGNSSYNNNATEENGGNALWAGQYVHENVAQIGKYNKDTGVWTKNPNQSFLGGKNSDIVVDDTISIWDGNYRY